MSFSTSTATSQNGAFNARKGSIFRGTSKVTVATPASTRPSTSSGSVSAKSSHGSVSDFSSASSTDPPLSLSLSRNTSSSVVSKPFYRRPSITTESVTATVALPLQQSPGKRPGTDQDRPRSRSRPRLPGKSTGRKESIVRTSSDITLPNKAVEVPPQPRSLDRDSFTSTTPYSNMLSASSFSKEVRPLTSHHTANGGLPMIASTLATMPPGSPTLETITYQHIQDMASKRISTLVYLRKAHEGRVYWFNTLLYEKPDLVRMPYFDSRKLARRATNYLLLGLSLPTVLDTNSSSALDFLRTLTALLGEFETFQQIHPPDGTTSSSLSRARLPQMFKRAAGSTGGKARRTSSAADIGLPMGNDSPDMSAGPGSSSAAFPSSENELLPGEEYFHLLTPSLPFDPDFYETFATLCDVLIDCYTKLMSLLSSPRECGSHVAELFTKADARIRKIIIQGVVKEFEDTSRSGIRGEVASVGKVVLGGLM